MMSCSLHSPAPKGHSLPPAVSPAPKGRPSPAQANGLGQPRAVLPRSPERAQYELRAQSHLSRPFRARNINRLGLLTQAVSLG